MNDGSSWPAELDACHRLIEQLSSRLKRKTLSFTSKLANWNHAQAFAQEQSRTVVDLEASHQQLSHENEELKLTIRKLMERLYGRRSERFVADPNQIQLDFGDDAAAAVEALAEAVWEAEQTIEEVQTKRRAKRRKPRRAERKVPGTLAALRADRRSARGEKAGQDVHRLR